MIVDEVIGFNDAFVSAENYVFPGNKREIFFQPLFFFIKRKGKLHGSGNNIQVKMFHQCFDSRNTTGNQRNRFEKSRSVNVTLHSRFIFETLVFRHTKQGKPVYFLARLCFIIFNNCLLYTSPSPRDGLLSRMPSSA